MGPRVSILISSYNAGKYLKDALDSVYAQTFTDFELIVVDDGSEDDTADVVAQYPQVRYFPCAHHGVSIARNTAIVQAKGEILTFLDADDLWAPDKLEKQVAYLDSHPDCQLVFTGAANFFEGQEDTMSPRQRQLYHASLDKCIITCAFRRSIFETWGMFRTDYPYGEDTQFMFRLCAAGLRLSHCIPEVLYRRRVHDKNLSLVHGNVEVKDILAITADAIRQVRKKAKEQDPSCETPMCRSVSVIIPAYESENYIAQAVDSVVRQKWAGEMEIIVIDDGSSDRTAQAARRPGVQVLRKARGGASSARNAGLKAAKGELILLLDADDVLTEGALNAMYQALCESGAGVVFAMAEDFISPELSDSQKAALRPRPNAYGGVLPGCSLIRREVFETVGMFDDTMKSGETVAWQMKLRDAGIRTAKIPTVTLKRRLHLTNTGRLRQKQEMADYAALLRKRMKRP